MGYENLRVEARSFLQEVARMAYGSGRNEGVQGGAGRMGMLLAPDGTARVIKFNTNWTARWFGTSVKNAPGMLECSNELRRTLVDVALRAGLGEEQMRAIRTRLGLPAQRPELPEGRQEGSDKLLNRADVAAVLRMIGGDRVWRDAGVDDQALMAGYRSDGNSEYGHLRGLEERRIRNGETHNLKAVVRLKRLSARDFKSILDECEYMHLLSQLEAAGGKDVKVAREICRRAFGGDFLGELERANHLVAVNPEKLKERLGEMFDDLHANLKSGYVSEECLVETFRDRCCDIVTNGCGLPGGGIDRAGRTFAAGLQMSIADLRRPDLEPAARERACNRLEADVKAFARRCGVTLSPGTLDAIRSARWDQPFGEDLKGMRTGGCAGGLKFLFALADDLNNAKDAFAGPPKEEAVRAFFFDVLFTVCGRDYGNVEALFKSESVPLSFAEWNVTSGEFARSRVTELRDALAGQPARLQVLDALGPLAEVSPGLFPLLESIVTDPRPSPQDPLYIGNPVAALRTCGMTPAAFMAAIDGCATKFDLTDEQKRVVVRMTLIHLNSRSRAIANGHPICSVEGGKIKPVANIAGEIAAGRLEGTRLGLYSCGAAVMDDRLPAVTERVVADQAYAFISRLAEEDREYFAWLTGMFVQGGKRNTQEPMDVLVAKKLLDRKAEVLECQRTHGPVGITDLYRILLGREPPVGITRHQLQMSLSESLDQDLRARLGKTEMPPDEVDLFISMYKACSLWVTMDEARAIDVYLNGWKKEYGVPTFNIVHAKTKREKPVDPREYGKLFNQMTVDGGWGRQDTTVKVNDLEIRKTEQLKGGDYTKAVCEGLRLCLGLSSEDDAKVNRQFLAAMYCCTQLMDNIFMMFGSFKTGPRSFRRDEHGILHYEQHSTACGKPLFQHFEIDLNGDIRIVEFSNGDDNQDEKLKG